MSRFLPYLIVCLLLVVGVKLFDFIDQSNEIVAAVEDASADETTKPSQASDEAENIEKKQDAKIVQPLQKAMSVNKGGINSVPVSSQQASEQKSQASKPDIPDLPEMRCITNASEFLPSEVEGLKSLKKRRSELSQKEQELVFRESTVQLAREQVESSLSSLGLLRDELKTLIKQYEVKENEKQMRLVRVYESMKPREAAKIFEEIQLNVLLDVVEKMRETRLGPILAAMEPVKAKELTVALVNKRKSIYISR